MSDEEPRKKSKRSLRDVLRIASPILETFLTYYYVSAPLLFAILFLLFINTLEKLGIHSTLTDPSFKIGLYFAIWGFAITLLMLIQSDIKINRLKKEIKEIKKFFGLNEDIKSGLVIDKSARNHTKSHLPWALFILGIFILVAGAVLYYIPTLSDRPGAQTWEGISLVYNNSFNFSTFQFNFVTLEQVQYLHIAYNIFQMKNGTQYALLIIPYVGKLQEDTPPNGWTQHNVSSSNTSILYKKFQCPETNSYKCYDQKNLYFYFDPKNKIDSKQYYIHSINIPFAPMLQTATVNKVDEILKGNGTPTSAWKAVILYPPIIRVTVNSTATQFNPIPDGYMTSFRIQPANVSATVFVWSLPDHDVTFHLDYVDPFERRTFDDLRNVSLILIGSGLSFMGIAIAEYFRKNQKIQV